MRRLVTAAALATTLIFPAAASATLSYVREFHAPLAGPWGVAAGTNDMVYVADAGGQQIVAFNQNGGGSVIATAAGGKPFSYPSAIAVDENNNVYVADTSNSRVVELDAGGGFIRQWGTDGSGPGQLNNPLGIDAAMGRVLVADSRNNRIEVFNTDGTFRYQFGAFGTGDGMFDVPAGVAFGVKTGIIYTTEEQTSRVQRFTGDSHGFAGTFGTMGNGDGQLNFPEDIAVDPNDGSLYVVSAGDTGGNLQHFTPEGKFIERLEGTSTPAGAFTGHGVAIDQNGFIYVADPEHKRVVEFTQKALPAPIPQVFAPSHAVYRNGVKVPVQCNVDCTVKITGGVDAAGGTAAIYKFKPVTKSLLAGQKVTLKLTLSARGNRAVKRALARHRKVTAIISGTAVNASGARTPISKRFALR